MNAMKKLWDAITAPIMALVVNIGQSKEEGDWNGVQNR